MNSWYPFKKGAQVERGENKYAYLIPSQEGYSNRKGCNVLKKDPY